jgi:O-antigen/teichoic acid export membrane protein
MGVAGQSAGTRTTRAAGGVATSIVQYGLQIALQAVLMPVVLRQAGQEALGVYAVVIQCVGYLTLTDLGFGAATSRYLAQAHGSVDGGERFSSVIGTARLFSLGSNALFFLLCCGLVWLLPSLVAAPPSLIAQGRWALALVAIWSLLRTPLVVSAAALAATQHLARANLAATVGNAFRIVASLALVVGGGGLFGLLLGHLLGEVATLLLQGLMFRAVGPNPRPAWALKDRALAREMLGFGIRAFGISVGVRLIFQTDAIVVGYLFGSAAASVYYSTQIPATILYNVPLRIADNASPAVNELWARGEKDRLRAAYLKLLRYTLLVAVPLGLGVAGLNGTLVRAWLGPAQYAGASMSLALGIFTVLINASHVGFVIVIASGRIGTLGGLVLAEGLANLALSFVLGRALGLPGVMWATVITNLVSSSYLCWKAQHVLAIPWRDTVAALRGLAVPVSAGVAFLWAVHAWLGVEGWAGLLLAGTGLVAIYGFFAWRMAITAEERGWAMSLLARIAGTAGPSDLGARGDPE